MHHIKKRDFFYGAALYTFLQNNKDANNIAIIETEEHYSIFRLSTNNSQDFYIYLKHTEKRQVDRECLKKYVINLSDKDKLNIDRYINSKSVIYLFFVLGNSFKDAEILILNIEEYQRIKDKQSITIKLEGYKPNNFIIHTGQSKEEIIKISRSRLYELNGIENMNNIVSSNSNINPLNINVSEAKHRFIYKTYSNKRKHNKHNRKKHVINRNQISIKDFKI